jgi:endonuclease YncB( thermonuclease family)
MKKYLFLLLLSTNVYAGDFRVVDGDTIAILKNKPDLNSLPLSIRILNIDTPEIKGKCELEKAKAQEAKLFVEGLINNPKNKVTYKIAGWDKYGGRVLGNVFVNGKNLSELMIAKGLAREYHGKKKSSWCD